MYKYDKLDRLQEIDSPNRGVITYTYDLRGNRKTLNGYLTLDLESADYAYDLRNRLTQTTKGSITANISYNTEGLRYKKSTLSKTVQYHYNLSGEVIAEGDGTGNIKANYVWGPDRTLVKKDSVTGNSYYYLYNGHGDVVQMVDTAGNVVNNYSYDEWGNILDKTEAIDNPFKYAGEVYDDETGLYYLRARYYDPQLGRFINEDSYEGQVNNPLTLNLYTYGLNNPLKYLDPSGNMSIGQFFKNFLPGFISGMTGFDDLKNLFSMNTINAIKQFGASIGQINIGDIISSVGASFVEPFQYLAEHSKNVWTGKPSDAEVYEYGKQLGNVTNMVVGAVGGGGLIGAKLIQTIGKVCPKFMKLVQTVEGASKAGRSNGSLVQEIATRAEKKIGGTGAVAGTKKHTYARDLLNRYQSIYGDRGLEAEKSWLNGNRVNYGTSGSARIDVRDVNTGEVWDCKFTTNPGNGLSQSQISKILNNGPAGITSITEVNP
jgi:RHS repeat-associated protein